MPFGCMNFYSTPISASDATPASHVTSHRFRLVTQRNIRSYRPGWSLPGLTVRRFQFPDRFPSMPVCPKENRPCPFRPDRAAVRSPGGGLCWALAEIVCGLIASNTYAWVLLVEILR
jgi:hypothetical protein